MPKKQTQRGCALSKKHKKQHNKSVKQRGGNLHKMYNINNLATDPQRMMVVDRGSQAGGKKHGHARKYLKKHGKSALQNGKGALQNGKGALQNGGALGALNTVIDQIGARFISTPAENLSKPNYSLV